MAEEEKLREYREKRDFTRTPEPPPERSRAEGEQPIYVIQKHHASRLHYDLRLEHEGVLKSWAIPKEPPRTPGPRRLAVQTEDHPLEYANFEGIIEEGLYGAGRVEIWDKGTYSAEKINKKEILIELNGKKLKGNYALIKLKPNPRFPGKKNWLFFKRKR